MVPEKGRNATRALSQELDGQPYDLEWFERLINDTGKRAAKTGDGFDAVREAVAAVDDRSDTLAIALKDLGRRRPRPVFDALELTDRTVEGYESPSDAWQRGASRFYAGYDELCEALLRRGAVEPAAVERGLEAVARDAMADRGYDLAAARGDAVRWAAMSAGDALPDDPEVVLVPPEFQHLGRALAGLVWPAPAVETFDEFAAGAGLLGSDEEAIVAAAGPEAAGVYMVVSGGTAEAHGLTYEAIDRAESRLGVFERERPGKQTMAEIESLKGFYDRLPDEFAAWRAVVDVVEETAREFGFREINTPAVERTALYRVKSGDELLEQTYSFEDRGGREVTLTPEQTPTRARIVQERKDLKLPIKWYDTSKRWRYENVQKGRDREFFQTDVDVFGIESVAADAEVIACAATIYRKLGVSDRVEFLVSDRNLLEALLEAEGVVNTTEVMKVVDDKEKLTEAEFREALQRWDVDAATAERIDDLTSISGPLAESVEELRDLAPDDEAAVAAIDRMESLADALAAHDVEGMCKLDLSIVRGLAYYTGLVFEAFDSEGELRALFGGGRYDDLVGLFGEREVPAVGFAFGYSTTRELLQQAGEWPDEAVSTDVYVLSVSDSVRDVALEYARELRDHGLVVETDLASRSVGGQFSYADSVNADWAVVVGERDLERGEVTLQNMETGEERQVDEDGVVEELKQEGVV